MFLQSGAFFPQRETTLTAGIQTVNTTLKRMEKPGFTGINPDKKARRPEAGGEDKANTLNR
jgi:hypothetical protein